MAECPTFGRICRACMCKEQNFHSMLEFAEQPLLIYEMFATTNPQIVIQPGVDRMPELICAVCLDKLQAAYHFQLMCIASDKQMQTMLNENEILQLQEHFKVEIDEEAFEEKNGPLEEQKVLQSQECVKEEINEEEVAEVPVTKNYALEENEILQLQEHFKVEIHEEEAVPFDFGSLVTEEVPKNKLETEQEGLSSHEPRNDDWSQSKETYVFSMPSTKKSLPKKVHHRKPVDSDVMAAAIKAVKIDNKPIKSTARKYGIARSTLQLNLKKVEAQIPDISSVPELSVVDIVRKNQNKNLMIFTSELEAELLKYIVTCSNHYYGLSVTELRQLGYEFAKKCKIEFPENWNKDKMAGKKWYRLFMKRHTNLSLLSLEQACLNRVKSLCPSNVEAFFKKLDELTNATRYTGANIWNMDETDFSTVSTKVSKMIAPKDAKSVGQISSLERESMVTTAVAVNADGRSIPPFFLFPTKQMQTPFMDMALDGSVGYANDSGCMQQAEFLKYMEHFIEKSHSSKAAPVLLLLDTHTSYLSIEALDLASENGVTLLSFPPHCSHRMQPLDVSVYGPVKSYYKIECSRWHENNADKALELHHVVGLISTALNLALTPRNIKAGFIATGIHPFNSNIFTVCDFVEAEFDIEREVAIATEKNANEDDQRRIVVVDTPPPTSLPSLVAAAGPLKATTPKPPSNRGRKSTKSTVLTAPELISEMNEKRIDTLNKIPAKASKRAATTATAKTPAKRGMKKP